MKTLAKLLTFAALLFMSAPVFAQFTQKEMITEWQRAKTYTKAYLDAMPEDGYAFKATPEIRSFAQQMLHLGDANYMFATEASGKPNPVGASLKKHDAMQTTFAQTKEAVTKGVMDSYDFVISTLQGMTPEQLQESIKFAGKIDISRGGLFGKAFEHQTHHRGQTVVYLRLKGVTPPPEQLF